MTLPGKILIVDDHYDLAENLAEILDNAGYQTATAASAEVGLERVERGDIAALITDYRLPGRNGAQLIAELRRRGIDIPAVVMSAFTDEATIVDSRVSGALAVLPKPVALDQMLSLVAEVGKEGAVVLLVEDNSSLAENLAEVLRSRGYQAWVRGSVAEALTSRPFPDAAIVDYRLPDGTGVDVAERLATRDPATSILFLSGHADELADKLTGQLAGVPRLTKPVDPERLLTWLSAAVGNGRTARPRR
jgi:two-component system, response regulator PdtaR